jgi:colanic acid/amylovoran biosynthesis glycosyltransferase
MTDQTPLPPVCIVAPHFTETTQTFVHRHVRDLNGGNTVLVARQDNDAGTYGKPLLQWQRAVLRPAKSGLLRRWFGPPQERDLGTFPDDFAAFVHRHKVSVVLCEFGTTGVHFSALCRQAGVPMLCYFRGHDSTKALRERGYRQALGRMFAESDGVVAVSAYLLGRLAKRGFVHPNAHVIPSGVDSAAFMPEAKDPDLILAVGRMVEKKAPLTTIRAFARVAAMHPTIRLEMIGDGWLMKRGRKLVARLGLEGRVVLHGEQGHEFVAERMRRAAIFMQHSVTSLGGDAEGAPTAIQEAMTAGAAVVSTRHAGIPELIEEGVTGLLVREHDLGGYARALQRLVETPALREKMGRAAHAYAVEKFDYRKLYSRLEAAMAAAIAARSP